MKKLPLNYRVMIGDRVVYDGDGIMASHYAYEIAVQDQLTRKFNKGRPQSVLLLHDGIVASKYTP